MALSSFSTSRLPPSQTLASSTGGRATDTLDIVESLAVDCLAASEVVARDRALRGDAETLRHSARELALLVDACGGGVLAKTGTAPEPAAKALAFVIARYRASLEAPLPRAVREVLRTQLDRLVRADEGRVAA